jgi:malate/lactate dehydrogenase
MKVTIVGAGNVATCADVISYRGIASEVVLLDIKEGFAEALDIINVQLIQDLILEFQVLLMIIQLLIVMW